MRIHFCLFSLFFSLVMPIFAMGCGTRNEEKTAESLRDIPLEPYQTELLDIAFRAASAMPVYPHIKNRSRAQETVVTACLELKQPLRALRYIEQIDNWRRGTGYADLAFYCAQNGFKNAVETYLDQAAQISEKNEEWRKDRIKVKISRTYTLLGQTKAAARFERDVEDSETGKVAQVEAVIGSPDSFDEIMKDLDTLVSDNNFDTLKNALEAYPLLYNRFYEDMEKRTLIERKIRTAWVSIPISIRIDLLTKMADFSLAREDRVKALEIVDEAKTMMDSAIGQLRFRIPIWATLARLRYRAGEKEQARTEMKDALNMFDKNRAKIVNIYRAGIFRSIAEAYQVMDDTTIARDLYERALEAGIENPNSRPRAEDLTATCCSMALYAVEPGEVLFGLIREIYDGLGDPW
jgi:tetratricopeptide (TPR) repeat protein